LFNFCTSFAIINSKSLEFIVKQLAVERNLKVSFASKGSSAFVKARQCPGAIADVSDTMQY
jgi:hypothetical protein